MYKKKPCVQKKYFVRRGKAPEEILSYNAGMKNGSIEKSGWSCKILRRKKKNAWRFSVPIHPKRTW
jgi:hypothetical protein